MQKGIIYIAHDHMKYVNEAVFSAKSVRKHVPKSSNIKISLITNIKVQNPVFDSIIYVDHTHMRCKVEYVYDKSPYDMRCKVEYVYDKSPYDMTLYIDTDTMINHDISDIFTVLERFDLAMIHDFARKRVVDLSNPKTPSGYLFANDKRYNSIPYSFPEYNGGVMAYRKNKKVKHFFSEWKRIYHEMIKLTRYDQPSLRIALWNSDLRIHTLPLEYNRRAKATRDKNIKYRTQGIFQKDHLKTRIFHFHGIQEMNMTDVENTAQII